MKVKIRVYRDVSGTLQPAQYVNEQTAVRMLPGRGKRPPVAYASVNITPKGYDALAEHTASGEVKRA